MNKLFNLARMSTATTGTGTITLGAAVSGFLTFADAGVSDGDVVSYGIFDGSAREVGYGTYASSGTTLTRTVVNSTNSNTAISLSGTAEVFVTPIAGDIPFDGWTPLRGTLTYSSADSPTFVASTSVDLTGIIPVGARIKLTQTTAKYFIVTAIASNSITLYGGTDYTLANATISSPFFSIWKAPVGFPLSTAKWQVTSSDASQRSQSSPTSGTWYNVGSLSISAPIGVWNAMLVGTMAVTKNSSSGDTIIDVYATLSTANNSSSNTSMTGYFFTELGTSGTNDVAFSFPFQCNDVLTMTSKTTLYINLKTGRTGMSAIRLDGNTLPTRVVLTCAYL